MERTGGLYAKMEQLALRADASHLTRKASEQGIFAFTATLVVSGCAETEWGGQECQCGRKGVHVYRRQEGQGKESIITFFDKVSLI